TKIAVREMMEDYGYQRGDIHQAYADWHMGQRPNLNEMLTAINNGVGFINFRGYNTWGEIHQNHILGLQNDWLLSIVTGMVCGTNDFANTYGENQVQGGCRGEAFLRAWRGGEAVGGVACFGPTDLYTHTWFNNTMDGAFYDAILDRDVSYLGVACVASKLALLHTYPSSLNMGNGNTVGYYFYTYTLLGDPTMQIRTREPAVMEADFPGRMPAGETFIDVLVYDEDENPIKDAYVHVYLNDDVRYGAFTDDDGAARLIVEPLEEGEYKFTVTRQNYIPVIDGINVTPSALYLSIDGSRIDDDEDGDSRGNSDGALNPDETVELMLILRNTGSDDCDGATVTMTTNSTGVEILRGVIEYGAVNPGETVESERPFVLGLAPETPDGEAIDLALQMVCGDEEWNTHFSLPVTGYRYEVTDHLFLDGDLQPGEEQDLLITIMNQGGLDAEELNATLYCQDPKIQIRRAETIFERNNNGSMDNENLPFQVFAGPNAYQGSELAFGLLLSDEDGLSDSITFSTILGDQTVECPQGPDGYGYWAFDNRDAETDLVPEYDWIPGRDRVGNLPDPHDQGYSSNHGSRVFVDLPFEFVYYGRRYDEITIGSNGWLCFGRTDQIAWNNQGMGSPLAPPAMLAPFWTDIWTGTVYTRYDDEEARFVVEWRDWACQLGGGITFEVILYDPTVVATRSGDGEIVFQYNSIPRLGARRDYPLEQTTIGICSHNRADRLEITHGQSWDPRTADLESEMAIRFSTGAFNELGGVHGRVIDITDETPIEGARVMIDGTGFFDNTDEDGNFDIQGVPVGGYGVTACRRHYNNGVAADVRIVEDESQEVNFALTHPTFNIDIEDIDYGLRPDSSGEVGFNVWNEGNGPLDYSIRINHEAEPPGDRDDPFDLLFDYNLTDTSRTGDYWLKGVTFGRDSLFVSGTDERGEFPHKIYILNREGELLGDIDQYAIDSTNRYGYNELTWNGENLLAIDRNYIVEITPEGELVDTIRSPLRSSASAVVWARERGTIFTSSITSNEIFETDRDGGEVATYGIGGPNLRMYGLCWFPVDPDGFPLYIWVDNTNYTELGPRLRLMKLNLETGEIVDVHFFDFSPDDKPEGCVITKHWDPMLWTFIGLVSNPDGDRVFGVELGPNLTWIEIDPAAASVPPAETQNIAVRFYASDMPERDYYVVLELFHNAMGDRYDIPVYFTIDRLWNIPDQVELPLTFRFDPPCPNPFNPVARLNFTLAERSPVELAFYDISGRLVGQIDFGLLEAGGHSATFDGAGLPSGVYLAQLQAGSRTVTQKMVLMK
ncbi:MAG TPA: T9SS type A sorting domain-containing protein, partial [Bacteroidetes bacterium]|nr:T9SS type A sorting domain-containing protein [Bacteroidota bacterium]